MKIKMNSIGLNKNPKDTKVVVHSDGSESKNRHKFKLLVDFYSDTNSVTLVLIIVYFVALPKYV